MRISDWSSDVCSSDLHRRPAGNARGEDGLMLSTAAFQDANGAGMTEFSAPLRLRMDEGALLSNWRWLKRQGGEAACGSAIKADGYGLGAVAVMGRLLDAGCRCLFFSDLKRVV